MFGLMVENKIKKLIKMSGNLKKKVI